MLSGTGEWGIAFDVPGKKRVCAFQGWVRPSASKMKGLEAKVTEVRLEDVDGVQDQNSSMS